LGFSGIASIPLVLYDCTAKYTTQAVRYFEAVLGQKSNSECVIGCV